MKTMTTIQIRMDQTEKDLILRMAIKEGFSTISEYCRWIIRGNLRPKLKDLNKEQKEG